MTANNNLVTNFNEDPYYDDFDDTKNFHRIMYRPGFAVQARELTQQQTILQNQIHRFGNHVFRDGSEVTGTTEVLDQAGVFRLKATYGGSAIDVSTFDGMYARTRGTELLFKVKRTVPAAGGDSDLIFAQFIQEANTSGLVSASVPQPANGEIIDFSSSFVNSNNVFTANAGVAQILSTAESSLARSPVTRGFLYGVDEAVYYHKGLFIRSPRQSVVIAANVEHTVSIGFTSTESIVTSDIDSTLTDPARGSYNYAAPGADRLNIELSLTVKPVADIASPPLSSNNYFEVARIQNGEFSRKRPAPDYNVLGDELAKRTYEESGHYNVDGHTLTFGNTSPETANIIAQFTPGTAYVKGYRIRTPSVTYVDLPKARSIDTVTEQKITALYGNYLIANTFTTALFDTHDRVELHGSATPNSNSKIGEAHIKNIEYYSGSSDQRTYKLFLYDVRITASDKVFNNIKSIIKGTHSSVSASAQVHSDSVVSFTKTGDITSGSAEVVLTSGGGVQIGQAVENDAFPSNTHVSSIAFDTATLTNAAVVSNSASSITFRNVNLVDKNFNTSLFPMPHTNVANTVNVDYKFKRRFTSVTFTNGSATIQTLNGKERFSSGAGTLANENFIVVVTSGGVGSVSTGENIDMTSGLRSVTTPTPSAGNPATATINVDQAGFNGTADILAAIDITDDTRRVKTKISGATKTYTSGYPANGTKLSLGYADVIKINSIYEGNSSIVAANSSFTEVSNKFNFNTGQRDSFYDHGTIELKAGQAANNTNRLLVNYDYYSHGGGSGFFSEKSYSSYDNIPTYTDGKGKIVYLRDQLDFRPTRAANSSSSTYDPIKSFNSHQIVDSQTFEVEADYSFYKKVKHSISLDQNKNFIVSTGASSDKNPSAPLTSPDQMLMATITMNPYTYNEEDLVAEVADNQRYTMRDIGMLEDRIENLEYYTSLNLLESQVASTQFLDDQGEARYKNGFIVDPFLGHSVGDVFDSDYKAAIDRQNQLMRPRFNGDSAPMTADSGASLAINNKLVTLPFTEAAYALQSEASGTININPFQVVTFTGNLDLDPDQDIWVDNISTPTVVTNFQGQLDHFKHLQSQVGSTTSYGNWRVTSAGTEYRNGGTGQQGTYVEGGQSEYVVRKAITSYTTTRSLQLTSSISYDYMRPRKVYFEGTNLRPNTRLYVFMGGTDISDHAAPISSSSSKLEQVLYAPNPAARTIFTDPNGKVSGYFWVPNSSRTLTRAAYEANPNALPDINGSNTIGPDGRRIPVGTVDIMLVDNFVYPSFSQTIAASTFTAGGTQNKYQLVTTSSSRTTTSKESGDFLRTNRTIAQVSNDLPSNIWNGSSNQNGLANFIAGVYRNNADINRAPEEGGFKYWLQDFLHGHQRADDGVSMELATAGPSYPYTNGQPPTAADFVTNPLSPALQKLQANMGHCGKINGEVFTPLGACPWGTDPLAQTFLVPAEFYPHGIFVTSVDLFMATKDLNNLPMRIELRPTVNGYPSADETIRHSSVSLNPNQVNANPNTPEATNVQFKQPIYLEPGEYSLVLLSDSLEYFTYIATIGEDRLDGSGKITAQPTLGSLFKSQNARTWTPQQESDLCFNLYHANFETGTTYAITMSANNAGRAAYSATANTVGEYDLANIVMPREDSLPPVSALYQLRTKNLGGLVQPFINVTPNQDLVFNTSKEITTNSDLQLKASFNTSDTNVSPSFKLGSTGITLVKNIINPVPSGTFVPETSPTDGYALSKYITRKVTLGEGLSAKNLKVFVDQNMPKGATVEVYYRVINNDDDTNYEDRPYVQMSRRQEAISINEDLNTLNEYEYFADGITYKHNTTVFDHFDAFSIKIVMYASSTAAAPSFRNFRAIALA